MLVPGGLMPSPGLRRHQGSHGARHPGSQTTHTHKIKQQQKNLLKMPVILIENGEKKIEPLLWGQGLIFTARRPAGPSSHTGRGPLTFLFGGSTWSHVSRTRFSQSGLEWLVGWLSLWGPPHTSRVVGLRQGSDVDGCERRHIIILEKHILLCATRRLEMTRDYIVLEGRGAEEARLKKKALA